MDKKRTTENLSFVATHHENFMGKRRRLRTDGSPRLDRPTINGEKSEVWYIVWSDGRSQKRSTGTADRALAEQRLTRWLASRAKPVDVNTINGVLDNYVDACRDRGVKTLDKTISALRPIREYFGALPPSEANPAYQRKYTAWRKAQPRRRGNQIVEGPPVSDRAIAVELAFLRAALSHAEDEEIISRAPKVKLPRGAGVRRRKRFLSEHELAALIAATEADETTWHMKLIVKLALMTAQRGVAIRSLRWEHVDWKSRVVWFSQTDPNPAGNKNRQDIPLTQSLERILAPAREIARTDWVIEYRDRPVASTKKGFRALVRRAGLVNVRFHDLRRTVASHGLMRGHSLTKIAALLGDNESIVREHYAHVNPLFLTEVMPTLEGPDGDVDEG